MRTQKRQTRNSSVFSILLFIARLRETLWAAESVVLGKLNCQRTPGCGEGTWHECQAYFPVQCMTQPPRSPFETKKIRSPLAFIGFSIISRAIWRHFRKHFFIFMCINSAPLSSNYSWLCGPQSVWTTVCEVMVLICVCVYVWLWAILLS